MRLSLRMGGLFLFVINFIFCEIAAELFDICRWAFL